MMPNRSARILSSLLLAVTAASSVAQELGDTADRVAASLQRQGEADVRAVCAPDRAIFAAQLRRDYPKTSILYGGISPQSAYWPEVEQLRYQEQSAFCPDEQANRKAVGSALRASMSAAELDAALAFLNSTAGQKLYASAHAPLKKDSADYESDFEKMREKNAIHRKKLAELIARYRADPR